VGIVAVRRLFVHLRGRVVREAKGDGWKSKLAGERLAMQAMARTFNSRRRYEAAQRAARIGAWPLSRDGRVERSLPGPLRGWTRSRDLPAPAAETFRDWWRRERGGPA
jgi:L-lactate dehydrogenase complex protein LldF